VAPVCIWVVSLILGAISPGYDPIRRSISALVNTPNGWLLTIAFIVTGTLELAFAVGASRVIGVTRHQRRVVAAVIAVIGLLTLLFALFPTDPPGVLRTGVGRTHLLVALGYSLALPASNLVFGLVFARDPRWQHYRRATLLVMLAQVVLFPVLVVAVDGELPWLGLVERLSFGIPSAWQAWIAVTALRRGIR
jgi:hypothetical membrane protein